VLQVDTLRKSSAAPSEQSFQDKVSFRIHLCQLDVESAMLWSIRKELSIQELIIDTKGLRNIIQYVLMLYPIFNLTRLPGGLAPLGLVPRG